MGTNVCLKASIRQPFRSFLYLVLFGLVTFGFTTKAVEFILIQRETEVLGSYYRSIGTLENIEDSQNGDISAGIELIEASPYYAYGDQREIVSGVMAQTYRYHFRTCNCTAFIERMPEEQWPNVHTTDMWFTGKLISKEAIALEMGEAADPLIEAMTGKDQDETEEENENVVGYYLEFEIDRVFAAFPEYAVEGRTINLKFLFEGHESAIPLINEMAVGQRYFIRGWENVGGKIFDIWDNWYEIKPIDDEQLWYLPLEKGESIDLSEPAFASIKNKIDVLNENMHTLGIVATADMSAIPLMQESSRTYYLTAGRWLNHQDDLQGNTAIVVTEEFAIERELELGDKLLLTFRPLQDTYYGLIRDGVDSQNWRSYPTHRDTFKIVGIYTGTRANSAYYAYIPTHSLPPGFTSTTQDQFRWELDYSFVLESTRHEDEFVQAYKAPLEELGIRLTFLENNGPAYWASVDPIRRSLSADLLVFGVLLVVAFLLAVFLYQRQRRRDYAILRALGVPARRANAQLVRPVYLLGGAGITAGGLAAWNYALEQARETLSTIPTPGGVSPSAELSPIFLIGLCAAVFLLLALLSLLGAFNLARKPVFALLQGESAQRIGKQKPTTTRPESKPLPPISPRLASPVEPSETTKPESPVTRARKPVRRQYTPSALRQYVIHHVLRSRLKSFLTLAVALGFVLAAGWVRQTMAHSRMEVDRLYDTTVVEADILPVGSATREGLQSGFVYQKTVQRILESGFVESRVLEAVTTWLKIESLETKEAYTGRFPVYAYDSPEALYAGQGNPGSLSFAPEWDLERFASLRTLEDLRSDGVPALFPASLLEELEMNVGERVEIAGSGYSYACIIAGRYDGGLVSNNNTVRTERINPAGNYILVPLSVLEAIEGGQTKYTVAHFALDPAKNRALPQFRADMEDVMDVYAGGVRLVVWDEELRIVIDQLEKNISLLEVLYPVVIVVSALVGAGLCFLLLLQAAREAAILRVLGTTQTAVRLALISEPVVLSIIGVILSLGVSTILWMASGLVPFRSLLVSAGLYLLGALVGSVSGAIAITNKMPLELLQVKE